MRRGVRGSLPAIRPPAFYQCYATFIPKELDFRKDLPWCPPDRLEEALGQLRGRRARVRAALEELVRRA